MIVCAFVLACMCLLVLVCEYMQMRVCLCVCVWILASEGWYECTVFPQFDINTTIVSSISCSDK